MKKNTKRTILIVTVLVLIVSLLCACAPITEAVDGVTLGDQTPAQIVTDLFTIALRAVLLVIMTIIAKIGIPYLKRKGIMWMVQIFVKSAEKQGNTGAIEKERKKEFVIRALEMFGIKRTELIDNMIEAAVEELDKLGMSIVGMIDEGSDEPPTE
jgi:hypothetical protein